MNPWPLVIAELRSLRWSGLLVVVLLALAFAGGMLITMVERGLRESAVRVADDFDLVIGVGGSETQLVLAAVYLRLEPMQILDGAVLQKLQADNRIKAFAPIAFGDSVRGYPVIGTTNDLVTRWGRIGPAQGRLFARHEEAVVGAAVALPMGSALHPSHMPPRGELLGRETPSELQHRHGDATYTIVGRLPPLGSVWDRAILVPIESVWAIHGLTTGHAPESGGVDRLGPPWTERELAGAPIIVVKPRSVADAYALRAAWRRVPTTSVFSGEVLSTLLSAIGVGARWLGAIAIAVQVMVWLAAVAVIVVLISARRRSVVALYAQGAPKSYVMTATAITLTLIVGAAVASGLVLALFAARLAAVPHIERSLGLAVSLAPAWRDFWIPLVGVLTAPIIGACLAAMSLRGRLADQLRG